MTFDRPQERRHRRGRHLGMDHLVTGCRLCWWGAAAFTLLTRAHLAAEDRGKRSALGDERDEVLASAEPYRPLPPGTFGPGDYGPDSWGGSDF